jgi:hypothetical protein
MQKLLSRIWLSVLTLPFTWGLAYGQISIPSPWTERAESAIKESVFIVRVEYLLEEKGTGQRFGRNYLPYYNRIYTTGISAGGFIWTNGAVAERPWENDPAYDDYRGDVRYQGVVSRISVKKAGQADFVHLEGDRIKERHALDDISVAQMLPVEGAGSLEFFRDSVSKMMGIFLSFPENFESNDAVPGKMEFVWLDVRHSSRGLSRTNLNFSPRLNSGVVLGISAEEGKILIQLYGLMFPGKEKTDWSIFPLSRLSAAQPPPQDFKITPVPGPGGAPVPATPSDTPVTSGKKGSSKKKRK